MGRRPDNDSTVPALRLQRRILRLLTNAGCPVVWQLIRSSMPPCKPPAVRAALEALAAEGVLKHSTRREPFNPQSPRQQVDRDYWELADPALDTTDGA